MAAFEDKLQFYDRRPGLDTPPGLARDFKGTPVVTPNFRALTTDEKVNALLDSDDMLLPAPIDREGYYGDRHLEYWLSGYYDAAKLMEAPLESDSRGTIKYLDFGGCSGRVARHIARSSKYEAWLCDINARYIDWLDEFCARPISAFQNRPYPALPFASDTFDLISAFSVFTHIAEGELHWLLELRRIVRPGGLLYLTVHDDSSWESARTQDWQIKSLARGGAEEEKRLRRDIVGDIPSNRYILRYSEADAYNCNVFYKQAYLEKKWFSHFAAGQFVQLGLFQTRLILKK